MSVPSNVPPSNSIHDWHIRLRQILTNYFDEDELITICFDLNVDYESLPGKGKARKAMELIRHLAQAGRIKELIDYCSRERPNIPWSELRTAAEGNPLIVDNEPDSDLSDRKPDPQPVSHPRSGKMKGCYLAAIAVAAVILSAALGIWLLVPGLRSAGQLPAPLPTSTSLPAVLPTQAPKPTGQSTSTSLPTTSPASSPVPTVSPTLSFTITPQLVCKSNPTVPLKLYWSSANGDNFTTATQAGEGAAINAGYQFTRIEGFVFPNPLEGSVPLKLYWNADRADNFTTATQAGENDAVGGGYQLVRIEGYIFPNQLTGTIPLKLYWNAERGDNFTTATQAGEGAAIDAGYQFVRIEGYICP